MGVFHFWPPKVLKSISIFATGNHLRYYIICWRSTQIFCCKPSHTHTLTHAHTHTRACAHKNHRKSMTFLHPPPPPPPLECGSAESERSSAADIVAVYNNFVSIGQNSFKCDGEFVDLSYIILSTRRGNIAVSGLARWSRKNLIHGIGCSAASGMRQSTERLLKEWATHPSITGKIMPPSRVFMYR